MQVVEDREQRILRLFRPVEELDVVYDQHINELIKMDEVIDRIVPGMILELVDEFLGTHVQHDLIGMQAADFVANGL